MYAQGREHWCQGSWNLLGRTIVTNVKSVCPLPNAVGVRTHSGIPLVVVGITLGGKQDVLPSQMWGELELAQLPV